MKRATKIVWLEDHFRNFEPIAGMLKSSGFDVKPVPDVESFEAEVASGCDYAVLDNKIGDKHSVGKKLIDRLSAETSARLLLFSAYLPATKKNLTFEKSTGGGHIGYLRKGFAEFDTMREFYEHSASIIRLFFTSKNPTKERWNTSEADNPFSEFEKLSLSEKGNCFREAAVANRELLEGLWAKGAVAVLLPGGRAENYEAYFSRTDLPEQRELLSEYREKGEYPFLYSSEYSFDDVRCHAVEREGSIRVYPRIALGSVGSFDSFHFDTGADTSLLSEDYVNEVGNAKIMDSLSFPLVLRGRSHAALRISFSTFVQNSDRDGFPEFEPVEVPAIMLDSWSSSKLQVQCSVHCEVNSGAGQNCVYRRNGLIGRDLYVENDLQVILSADDPQVSVRRRKQA